MKKCARRHKVNDQRTTVLAVLFTSRTINNKYNNDNNNKNKSTEVLGDIKGNE